MLFKVVIKMERKKIGAIVYIKQTINRNHVIFMLFFFLILSVNL